MCHKTVTIGKVGNLSCHACIRLGNDCDRSGAYNVANHALGYRLVGQGSVGPFVAGQMNSGENGAAVIRL
jgi:hypothetical protein